MEHWWTVKKSMIKSFRNNIDLTFWLLWLKRGDGKIKSMSIRNRLKLYFLRLDCLDEGLCCKTQSTQLLQGTKFTILFKICSNQQFNDNLTLATIIIYLFASLTSYLAICQPIYLGWLIYNPSDQDNLSYLTFYLSVCLSYSPNKLVIYGTPILQWKPFSQYRPTDTQKPPIKLPTDNIISQPNNKITKIPLTYTRHYETQPPKPTPLQHYWKELLFRV